MPRMTRLLAGLPIALALVAITFAGTAAPAAETTVVIGTGGVTGVYYLAGGAICRLVNKDRKQNGIRCQAEATDGSISNIRMIEAGKIGFGIAQSDVQAAAYAGTGEWQGKPFTGLRSVFALHAEPVTMIARADSGIRSLADLKGKRVNIGNPGSGQRGTWELMEAEGVVNRKNLAEAAELKSAELGQALCDGRIDAYFWLVGHPSALTQETLTTCPSVLVPLSGPAIDRLVERYPYFRKATIPAGMYGNNPEIATFGVVATLVTSASEPEDVVYTMVKEVFDNLAQFKALHPAFARLKPEEMVRAGLTAPLHPGAVRYYRERGWM